MSEAEIKAILDPLWPLKCHDEYSPTSRIMRRCHKDIICDNKVLMTVYWDPYVVQDYQFHMASFSAQSQDLLKCLYLQSKDGQRLFDHPDDIDALPSDAYSQLHEIFTRDL